jgi:hypothetical protein
MLFEHRMATSLQFFVEAEELPVLRALQLLTGRQYVCI